MADMVELKIDGLAQFRRDLKALDSDLPKALRVALNRSVQLVVDDAKPRVPARSGRARKSIRVASTQSRARIRAGGKKVPYYPWLDFGGKVGRKHSVERQFRKRGRYIYLAYFEQRDSGAFRKEMEAALIDVARQAGLEVT